MHEMGLVQDLMQIVEDQARAAAATKVLKIVLEVGQLSGVVPEALSFSFNIYAETRPLVDSAVLEIERIPARGACRSCQGVFDLLAEEFSCPHCSSRGWTPVSGYELSIKELEVA